MDYTHLSLVDIGRELEQIARATRERFGRLDAQQLNWKPDATRWSVAQCLEHLMTANRLMLRGAADALTPSRPKTIWQRLPLLPAVFGPMMVRSQAPENTRRFTAPPAARPATSDVGGDIVRRRHEDNPRQRHKLRQRHGRVSGARRQVDEQVIQLAP